MTSIPLEIKIDKYPSEEKVNVNMRWEQTSASSGQESTAEAPVSTFPQGKPHPETSKG